VHCNTKTIKQLQAPRANVRIRVINHDISKKGIDRATQAGKHGHHGGKIFGGERSFGLRFSSSKCLGKRSFGGSKIVGNF
jgi:hypothetical protein